LVQSLETEPGRELLRSAVELSQYRSTPAWDSPRIKINLPQPRAAGFTVKANRDYQRLDEWMPKPCCFYLPAWTSHSEI